MYITEVLRIIAAILVAVASHIEEIFMGAYWSPGF